MFSRLVVYSCNRLMVKLFNIVDFLVQPKYQYRHIERSRGANNTKHCSERLACDYGN